MQLRHMCLTQDATAAPLPYLCSPLLPWSPLTSFALLALASPRSQNMKLKSRYVMGLEKLASSAQQVGGCTASSARLGTARADIFPALLMMYLLELSRSAVLTSYTPAGVEHFTHICLTALHGLAGSQTHSRTASHSLLACLYHTVTNSLQTDSPTPPQTQPTPCLLGYAGGRHAGRAACAAAPAGQDCG